MARQIVRHHPEYLLRLPIPASGWLEQAALEADRRQADREWAVLWCASLGPAASAAHTTFLRTCEDADWQVRKEAARALIRTDAPASHAIPMLSKMLLQDSNVCVRYWAAASLELAPQEAQAAIPALRRATNYNNEWFASRAREALRRIETASTSKQQN
jgi:HEAT repeat protein